MACPAITHPWFYRVERDGRTSYLLGTRHVGVGADQLPDAVATAFVATRMQHFPGGRCVDLCG